MQTARERKASNFGGSKIIENPWASSGRTKFGNQTVASVRDFAHQ